MAHLYDLNPHLKPKKLKKSTAKNTTDDSLPSDVEPKNDKPRGRPLR